MPPRTRHQSASPTKPTTHSIKAVPSPRKPSTSPSKIHKTPIKQPLLAPLPPPKRWKETYDLISKQRETFTAPVDVMGCDKVGSVDFNNGFSPRKEEMEIDTIQEIKKRSEKDRRLTCLVSLMLSSQTRDEITYQAILNLKKELIGSLSVDSLRNSSLSQIENCINKVGFWRKKAQFLKDMARDLFEKHDSDVPKTLEELVSLKGVGPKMAFLALSSAWSINLGIGVDTHVHRISNRLGWVKTSDPESTRVHLESWLPNNLFQKINHLLVGFGQVICLPVGPKCDECHVGKVAGLCPSFQIKTKKRKVEKESDQKTNKKIKKTYIKEEEYKSSRFFPSSLDPIKPKEEEEGKNVVLKKNEISTTSTSQVKIEIEDLKDMNTKEEADVLSSSPLTEIDAHLSLCSSPIFNW